MLKLKPPTQRMKAYAETFDCSTPVLLLGGRENSLDVTQHFGRLGIDVKVSGTSASVAQNSKFCKASFPAPSGTPLEAHWDRLLLNRDPADLTGHIVIPCNDAALLYLAERKNNLSENYILDDSIPAIQFTLLDKLKTLQLSRTKGVSTPNFWILDDFLDHLNKGGEINFPLLIKPVHSHKFTQIFKTKFFYINSAEEDFMSKINVAKENGLEIFIVELIPGPDSLLSSYYTYIDNEGRNLFEYTKRVLRRFPITSGLGSYHISEWLPETAEVGREFFKKIDFKGFGNVEFKRDLRDGKLKIIESNPRFTAAHKMIVNAGAPLDLIMYCHLTHQALPKFDGYEQDRVLISPLKDYLAYRQMSRNHDLDFATWLRSYRGVSIDIPFLDIEDLWPSIRHLVNQVFKGK